MTEEIIVDGVNVSRCKHYDIDNNYCDQSYLGEGGLLKNTKNPKKCEQSPNCYFKQLKRLEQENKEEKKAYNECMHYLACMTEQRNKLKTALEEIREIIRADCKGCTAECDCDDDCTRYKIKNKINEVLNDN